MSEPFFSIVIPTKNRAFLLRHAIESLLKQTFTDFEIIVADNDDTDATTQVIRKCKDPRLIHVRTGKLSMPDNWEAGCENAQGQFVCVLEDKQALKRRALERLHEMIGRRQPLVVKWQCDMFQDEASPARLRRAKTSPDGPRMISSDEALTQFCSDLKETYKTVLPLPQRGAFHKEVLRQIREGVMGRLFHPVSPDVNLALLALNYVDEILDVPAALGVYMSSVHSNGRSSAEKGALFQQFLRELQ